MTELIRVIFETPGRFSWLFGAGMSRSAGLPTAIDVIWDLKRQYYASEENQNISPNEIQNPAVRDKIETYMQSRGFPSKDAPNEYSRCFDLIFKDNYERQRNYLKRILAEDRISLTLGHRILATMMAMGAIRVVFSTNFDSVVEKAFANVAGSAIAPFHIEGSYAASAALNNDQFPIYVKLHGDFRYRSLKNLDADLQKQDEELAACLVNTCNRFGLVISGYSGRDESVMQVLARAIQGINPFPHGLFWTVMKGSKPLKAVTDLIEAAQDRGVEAQVVEIETFDSLMSRLWNQLQEKPAKLVVAVGKTVSRTVSLPIPPPGERHPILRTNALPVVGLPTKAFKLDLRANKEWDDLRRAEERVEYRILCTRETDVWAWGHEDKIREAFGKDIDNLTEFDIGDQLADLGSHLYMKRFLENGIARALKRGKPLAQRTLRGNATLIVNRRVTSLESLAALSKALEGPIHGQIGNLKTMPSDQHPIAEQVFWAEAIQLDLQQVDGKYYLLLRPDVFIWPHWARQDATAFLDQRRSKRFNLKANALLDSWLQVLLPSITRGVDHDLLLFAGPESTGNPKFTINGRTTFSRRPAA